MFGLPKTVDIRFEGTTYVVGYYAVSYSNEYEWAILGLDEHDPLHNDPRFIASVDRAVCVPAYRKGT